MKVTKRRHGYTISCTTSEFEALKTMSEIPGVKGHLHGNAKNGFTRRTKNGAFLRVDVDNSEREYPKPTNSGQLANQTGAAAE